MKPARRIGVQTICVGFLLACSQEKTDLQPMQRDWAVMGTEVSITVYRQSAEADRASADLDAAFAAVAEIDELMSLYKPDSELAALNTNAGKGAMPINDHVFSVLKAAVHYAALTGGALDITVEPIVRTWGFFDVKDAAVPDQGQIDQALNRTGMHRLTLNRQDGSAALKSNTHVDLGGIAKGYAVDRALAVLRDRDVPAALVNLGGTVAVTGTHPSGRPWAIGVRHPRDNRLIGEIRLREGAVSTSGDYDRYFEYEGKRYSHIVDPRSGWPVEGVYAVTVVAPNATAADALSTAAYVLGPEDGMSVLAACAGVEGMMIQPNSDQEGLAVRLTPSATADVSFDVDSDPTVSVHVLQPVASVETDVECVRSLVRH